jgi:hypothetical protein
MEQGKGWESMAFSIFTNFLAFVKVQRHRDSTDGSFA